jgi:hypothetical protein
MKQVLSYVKWPKLRPPLYFGWVLLTAGLILSDRDVQPQTAKEGKLSSRCCLVGRLEEFCTNCVVRLQELMRWAGALAREVGDDNTACSCLNTFVKHASTLIQLKPRSQLLALVSDLFVHRSWPSYSFNQASYSCATKTNMAALQPISRRASEMAGTPSQTEGSKDRRIPKQASLHKRKISASKAGVTFKSQTWSNPTSKHRTTFKARPTTLNKRAASDTTSLVTVTKQQSRFASLFISLLAVSPMAIEYDAADQQTMEAAQKASVKTTQPASSKIWPAGGVRPSEIRKTQWKRFKYEMGLKMKSTGRGKAKNRRKLAQAEDVELENMRAEDLKVQIQRQSSS